MADAISPAGSACNNNFSATNKIATRFFLRQVVLKKFLML